jgi:hypothetical protein
MIKMPIDPLADPKSKYKEFQSVDDPIEMVTHILNAIVSTSVMQGRHSVLSSIALADNRHGW